MSATILTMPFSGVTPAPETPHLPVDFAASLRDLADRIDRNEVFAVVVAFHLVDQHLGFIWPPNGKDAVALASLMQSIAVHRVTGGAV